MTVTVLDVCVAIMGVGALITLIAIIVAAHLGDGIVTLTDELQGHDNN